jgi:hypothetical protein
MSLSRTIFGIPKTKRRPTLGTIMAGVYNMAGIMGDIGRFLAAATGRMKYAILVSRIDEKQLKMYSIS